MKAYAIPLIVPGGRQYIQLLKEKEMEAMKERIMTVSTI
jgi:hypothetical protein